MVAPQWLSQVVDDDWFDRYAKRFEESRLPKEIAERIALADTIGADGMHLLDVIFAPDSPDWLAEVPSVETLRQTWVHQYYLIDGQLHWREAKDLPPSSVRYDSPYDPQAHYGTKRSVSWKGYKVHLTETCDSDTPHLITHVETTIAPKSDLEMTQPIHQAQHEAILQNRQQQKTPHWKKRYAQRAGIEGTVSQGVRAFGLRQARYIGLAKTHLQHLLTACAINVSRLNDWLTETPLAKTRVSRFSALRQEAA